MDTVRIESGACRMIAHRGASALERENTAAAFVAAANRTYYGIETDVRVTRDGQYAILHDNDLLRVGGVALRPEEATLAELQAVPLFDRDGTGHRSDLIVPTLADYLSICRAYGKEAVLELKGDIAPEHIAGIVGTVREMGHLDKTTFISFVPENLLGVRRELPTAKAQLLPSKNEDWVFRFCLENRIDVDICHPYLTKEMVEMAHAAGLLVNCWTVDTPEDAARVLAMGVDFITTNTLE